MARFQLNKGKVTSLVAKKGYSLATRIEEAIQKNESLESLSVVDYAKSSTNRPRVKSSTARGSNRKSSTASAKPSRSHGKVVAVQASRPKTHESKAGKRSAPTKARKSTVPFSKPSQSSSTSALKRYQQIRGNPVSRNLPQSSMSWCSGVGLHREKNL